MFMVPHYALGVELSDAYHERTRIFGMRTLMGGLGLLLGLGSFFALLRSEDPRSLAPTMAISISLVAAAATLAGIAGLRERPEFQDRGGETLTRAFWDVFRNPHARILLLMYGIESFGVASTGILSLYVTQYVVKAPQTYYLIVLILHVLPSFLLAPLWTRLSRRVGKRRLWLYSTLVASVFYSLHSLLDEGTIAFWFAISVVQGATAGVAQVVGPSIKGDVVDWDELQTGERKEGSYMATWTFVQKAAGGLCGIFVGFALQAAGFVPNEEQSEVTRWTILLLYGALPGAAFAVGAWLLTRFELNQLEHEEVRAGLAVRRNTGPR
jgi:GPH family glycoside/pentoside/hexuronide:cation symporter